MLFASVLSASDVSKSVFSQQVLQGEPYSNIYVLLMYN